MRVEIGDAVLYHGDCLELLNSVPIADVAITDVPYGIGENNKKNLARRNKAQAIDYGDFDWDSKLLEPIYISSILSVSKQQVIFGGNYYANLLPPSPSWIVWDKLNTGDFADCELAWTSHKRAARMFRYLWNGMIKAKPERRFHPTQKPLALMDFVVENYSSPGDLVIDPFAGSGTTGMSCMRLGRRFIGIEKDERYFAIAEKRIREAQSQMVMAI